MCYRAALPFSLLSQASGRGPQINEHLPGHLKQRDAILNSESPAEVRGRPGHTQGAHTYQQKLRRGPARMEKNEGTGNHVSDHETYTCIHSASVGLCQVSTKHAWEWQPSQKSCRSQGRVHLLRCILFNASLPSRNPPYTPHKPQCLYQGQVSAV